MKKFNIPLLILIASIVCIIGTDYLNVKFQSKYGEFLYSQWYDVKQTDIPSLITTKVTADGKEQHYNLFYEKFLAHENENGELVPDSIWTGLAVNSRDTVQFFLGPTEKLNKYTDTYSASFSRENVFIFPVHDINIDSVLLQNDICL